MKKTLTLLLTLILLQKLSTAQTFQWARSLGGTDSDNGYAIAIDATGNVYTTGRFRGTADFDPGGGSFNLTSAGGYDIFVSKLDASGNFIWAIQMGGSSNEDYGDAITVDAVGNIYVTGKFQGTADFNPGIGTFNMISAGATDIYISKLNASGNFIWAKQIGGADSERGLGIATDASQNIYVTGYFRATVDFDPDTSTFNMTSAGADDIFISKLDSSGNFIWAKQAGGSSGDDSNCLTVDLLGNVYAAGGFNLTADFDPGIGNYNLTSAGISDIFILKLDSSGNFIWAKSMGGTDIDDAHSIRWDNNGNVLITGDFRGTSDFDPSAMTFNITSAGVNDIYISKLDSLGNFVLAKSMGGVNGDAGFGIANDAAGNIYSTGEFYGTADFDPGVGTFNLTSAGPLDIFVSKLDISGNFIWAKQMGGDRGTSIAIDAGGNIYTTGYFYGIVDFDPGTGIFNLTSAGNSDIFIHKMSQTVGINENSYSNLLEVYPNPSQGNFIVTVSDCSLENNQLIVTNIIGEKVQEQELNFGGNEISITQPSGIYFLTVSSKNGNYVAKIIVQ